MQNLTLDDITDRIIDAILDSNMFNRVSLQPKIRAILKIWLKKTDETKKYKHRKKTPEAALQKTIESRELQANFWRQFMIDKHGKENMQPFYDMLNKQMIEKGYMKPKP